MLVVSRVAGDGDGDGDIDGAVGEADEVMRMMIWWLAENRWWPELFPVAAPEVERGEEDEMGL
ncbi:hypothetical protein Tco_0284066, partial [Tanacetum coccineum]